MNEKATPFNQWWNAIGKRIPAQFESDGPDEHRKLVANHAWIAALEHARQILQEPPR